ncbi:annexin-2 receptor [Phyllostomus discolor]|uniref:Annexin-2 receptor n=1 Tax=Phyllostomus discolor TaxID=89673 RepID=A0A6J2KZ37_9CHIR|nr:annexin-2 receptor [Phyllostomus discolor]
MDPTTLTYQGGALTRTAETPRLRRPLQALPPASARTPVSSWSEVRVREQPFPDAVKLPRDDRDAAPQPQPQPPWMEISEDSGPWPLPLYPEWGESAGHPDAYHGQLLSSPCWQLPSVYERYRVLSGAQSPREPSAAQPSPGFGAGTWRTPPEPAGAPEPAKDTASQHLPVALPPDGEDAGEPSQPCDSAQPSECRPARGPAGWRPPPFSRGCLQWVRRAVCTLRRWAAVCCRTFWD